MGLENFQQRLRDVIHELKIEHQEFARAGEVSKATLSGYIQNNRQPKADTLGRWVLAYNINANWLLTGQGSMFNEAENAPTPTPAPCIAPKTELGHEMQDIKMMLESLGTPAEQISETLCEFVRGARAEREQPTATGTDDDLNSSR